MTRLMDFGHCKEVGGQQYALNLYTLASSVEARTVLEIGSGRGWSTRAFACSLIDRVPATIWSIDPKPERVHPENHKFVTNLSVSWGVIPGKSQDVSFDIPVDLLFIDGDPARVREDFEKFYRNVKPGGLVVIDGVGGQSGPTTTFRELSSKHPMTTIPYVAGLYAHAVHQKPVKTRKVSDAYTCRCDDCAFKCSVDSWNSIDSIAYRHVMKTIHNVTVLAGPEGLRYKVGGRT